MSLANVITDGPQKLPPDFYRRSFKRFLEEYYYDEVVKLLSLNINSTQQLPFEICSYDLIHYDPVVGHFTLNHPKLLIPIFEQSLNLIQLELSSHPTFLTIYNKNNNTPISQEVVKSNVHIRFKNVPSNSKYMKYLISEIRSNDIGPLLMLSGTVIRTSPVKLLEMSKEYQCKRFKCGHKFRVFADPEQDNQLPYPRKCPSTYLMTPGGLNNSGPNRLTYTTHMLHKSISTRNI